MGDRDPTLDKGDDAREERGEDDIAPGTRGDDRKERGNRRKRVLHSEIGRQIMAVVQVSIESASSASGVGGGW